MSNSAWIFTLGNEVVEGRVVNTNAAFLGRRLSLLGFNVIANISLRDDVDLTCKYLKYALSEKPRLIITTGGLGPTYDDRTLEAVALAINRKLVVNDEALRMVKEKYNMAGLPMTEDRVKMAKLPEGAMPIPNPVGTAPGSWLEYGETIIISLPGVPRELEAMWESWVEPRLRKIAPNKVVLEYSFKVSKVPESSAAPVLKDIVKKYPEVYVKTHPKGHEISEPLLEVYVMAFGKDEERVSELIRKVVSELKQKFSELGGRIVS